MQILLNLRNHLKFHDPVPLELKFNEWKKLIKE